MSARRSAVVLVGHYGPLTGTWWQDEIGQLDEWELAARTATTILYRLHSLGWIAVPGSAARKNPRGLQDKREYVNNARPDLCIEVHYNEASKIADRDGRWPGCTGAPFADGHVPIPGVRGVSVLYNERNTDTKALAGRVVAECVERTGLPAAYGSGLDPRPVMPGHQGYIYLIAKTTCPTILIEPAFLSNADDRAVIRSDAAIFDKIGRAVGDAVQEWWHVRKEDPL